MPKPDGLSRGRGGHSTVRRLAGVVAIIALVAGACGSSNDVGSASTPIDTTAPSTTAAPVTTQAESTTTSAPTNSVADGGLTPDDFVGIWVSDASIYLIQYNADGTYSVALSEDSAPVESGEWELDGTAFTFNTSFSACPGILERPGRYEVERFDDTTGAVLWTVVDDPCQGRISAFEGVPWSPK